MHNAFGPEVPFFLGVLKPIALWFDLSTLGALAPRPFAGVFVVNLLFPTVIFLGLVQVRGKDTFMY